ncbi:mannonate dehydratase [Halogeometricum pallidum JCM 14848]|uniref:mannonate dehydratase n=1 Tax=Halogeometricum pallidum JCM 14848 TaxID=1227487 RepID=M0DBI8_HALPD|nr:mannonate dehydratase [Halogeometricum pallidum]ELZ32826.1 mannonate dehydratase [Halogeometricum pallidum JCM 14848]
MTDELTNGADGGVRVGVRTRSLSTDRLRFIRQLGATDVFVDHADTEEEPDEFNDREGTDTIAVGRDSIPTAAELEAVKARIEGEGLRFTGVQSLPYSLYGDVMFDREGADDALDRITTLVRNLGSAGVPILGYQWNPRGVVPMRTAPVELRGGAVGTAFDLDEIENPDELAPGLDRAYTEAEFWENYERFLETVLPVAEEAGVRLALHPVDPPVLESLGGIPRLFRNVENFERAMELVPSDNHGLKLCLGCFSQMGEDVEAVLRRFGERDQIVFVHFRDVAGTVPAFHETFVDEGNFHTPDVVRTLREVGYEGVVIPDHVPEMVGDDDWRHRARGFTVGYLRGVVDSVRSER